MTAVVLSPWLSGSGDAWAYLFICLLVGVGVAAWLISIIHNPQVKLRAPLLTATVLALLTFVLVQMIPLPQPPVRAISPLSAEAQLTRPQVFEKIGAEEFLPADLKAPSDKAAISASAAATRRSFYLLAAYIGVFLVMANAFTDRLHVRRAAAAITVFSFLMVVFALAQKFSGTRDIYWFHTPRFGGNIFGPFTNQNHFAAHISMAFGVALGLLLASGQSRGLRRFRTWRDKLAWLSTGQANRIALLWFATVLLGATVCVTLSRGGITSLAASLGIVGIFAALRGSVRNRGRVLAAVVLLVVAAVAWLGWRPVVERLGSLAEIAEDPTGRLRMVAARDTLRVFKNSPIVGCGFGSFQHVFPVFQSRSIQIGRWVHAHNDYAQLLAEGGIIGALLVVLAGVLFVLTLRKSLSTASIEGRLMVCGLAVGILAIALHSFVDFGLRKPSNALLLATMCGMSIAAARLRSNHRGPRTSVSRGDEPEEESEAQAQPFAEVPWS